MSVLPIRIYGDPVLRQVCAPVGLGDDVRKLAADMIETMYDAPGRGLAAPQVGQALRMFVMDARWKDSGDRAPLVVINPEIVERSDQLVENDEGCLSIPDQYADVTRPAEVDVRWLGLDGETHEEHFAGLWATCVQHEIDHLDGKLFIDYLKPLKRQLITRKMQKLKRERSRA